MSGHVGRNLLILAAAVILATVAAAVWVMGGPGAQRERRMDERRVEQLQRLERFIDDYHREHDRLPKSLMELAGQPGVALDIADPASGQTYEYAVDGPRAYRLCAVYQTDTAGQEAGPIAARWAHPRGGHCHRLEIEPDAAARPAMP